MHSTTYVDSYDYSANEAFQFIRNEFYLSNGYPRCNNMQIFFIMSSKAKHLINIFLKHTQSL